jgi:hypothetical protein
MYVKETILRWDTYIVLRCHVNYVYSTRIQSMSSWPHSRLSFLTCRRTVFVMSPKIFLPNFIHFFLFATGVPQPNTLQNVFEQTPVSLSSASTSNGGYGNPIQPIRLSLLLTCYYLLFYPFLPRRHLAHEYQPMAFTFHIESATLSVNNALFNCFYTRMHSLSQNILGLPW